MAHGAGVHGSIAHIVSRSPECPELVHLKDPQLLLVPGGVPPAGDDLLGQMGGVKVTVQNLEVVRVDADKNLLLVKGAVPGPKKALITIKESVKVGK